MTEDEGVNPRVRDGPRRQRFRTSAHHRANVGVLEQDDLRSPVSICVVMVFCTFRSSLILVIATCRLRQPVRLHALSQKGSFSVSPHRHSDARTSRMRPAGTSMLRSPRRLIGPLATNSTWVGCSGSSVGPQAGSVARRRAATHYLGYLLRRRVLRLDPGPLLHVEDLRQPTHALGEVQAPSPVVVDRRAGALYARAEIADSSLSEGGLF